MHNIKCIKCNKVILIGERKISYCLACHTFSHNRCFSTNQPYRCSVCGSNFGKIKISKKLNEKIITSFVQSKNQIFTYEFNGVQNASSGLDTEDEDTIIKRTRKFEKTERIGGLFGGVFLLLGFPFFIYLSYITYTSPQMHIIWSVILFILALSSFYMGIKTLLAIKKIKEPLKPIDLVTKFYKEALKGDPLKHLRLINLLSPKAIETLGDNLIENLQDNWYGARNKIENIYGEGADQFFINKFKEERTINSDSTNIILELIYYDIDYENYLFEKCLFLRFRNTAVKVDGKWRLNSAYPGKLIELSSNKNLFEIKLQ